MNTTFDDVMSRLRAEREEADRNPAYSVSYGLSDAQLGVTFDVNSSKREWIEQTYLSARCCYDDLVRYLRKLGFTLRPDKRTKSRYKTISPTRRNGWLGHLQLEISCSGRCVEIKFFQEMNYDNPHGGRYDFNRESKMPYLVRRRYEWTKLRLHEFMARAGIAFSPRRTPSPYPYPMAYFDDGWAMGYERMTGRKRFDRGENGWPSDRELQGFYAKNYDGDRICNADNDRVHYYRRRGRWLRCRVHGGINGQWLIILGGNEWTHDAAYTCSRVWRGRGRQFTDKERRAGLRRDLAKAIESRKFRRAAEIQEYCDRNGIDLTDERKTAVVA